MRLPLLSAPPCPSPCCRSKKKRKDEGAGAKEAKETVENLLSWMELAVEEDQKANEEGAPLGQGGQGLLGAVCGGAAGGPHSWRMPGGIVLHGG